MTSSIEAKKLAIAMLSTKLQPLLEPYALSWAEVVAVLEQLDVKQALSQPEAFLQMASTLARSGLQRQLLLLLRGSCRGRRLVLAPDASDVDLPLFRDPHLLPWASSATMAP